MTTEEKYPKHNKTHFYKYTDIETACLILQNKTWRWSSPSQFNDPFDVQSTLCFDCKEDVFRETLCKEIEEIVLAKKQVNLKREGIGEAIIVLRDKYLSQDCTKEYARAIIEIMVGAYGNLRENFRAQYFQWWQEALPYLRVFCVSEVKDSILMWSHYADYHEVVVFKLKVLHDKDNTLCVAGRVIYDKNPFTFFTTQEWIDDFIGIDEVNERKIGDKYIYHKNKIWDYEKEWRVWIQMTEKAEQEFTDYNVCLEEIEAVYFGCRTSYENRMKIIKLAREVNPKVTFFQGSKAQDRFGIVFDRI
ncbi:DUF2971 domain-containing protein [bacterium]|nr:DUF2971 domain-containing protein [bacterium]